MTIDSLESQFAHADSIVALKSLIENIDVEKAHLDTQVKAYVQKKSIQHQSNVRALEIQRVGLASTLNHSRTLKGIMENANTLGFHITDKVRILDEEKKAISELKQYVDHVNNLKSQMKKANDAIQAKDYLVASKAISEIRSIPPNILKDQYTDFKVPTSDLDGSPATIIQTWIDDLEGVYVSEFNIAASQKDVRKLTFFFQLFPLIGKSSKGVELYSKFICNIISENSRAVLKSIRGSDRKSEIYSQVLFKLFKTISQIINQHSKIIKAYYGEEVVLMVLKEIQMECDLQGNLIIDTYLDSNEINSVHSKITKYDYPILIKEITSTEIEPETSDKVTSLDKSVSIEDINNITDELSAMMNHWAMYTKFFTVFYNDHTDLSTGIYPQPLIESSFQMKVTETIIPLFDSFCTYAVRKTLEKACTIESLADGLPHLTKSVETLQNIFKRLSKSQDYSSNILTDEPPTSSLGDDLLIILNPIIMEVISTGELASIKNMISNIKRILVVDFTNIVQQKLNKLVLKSTSNLLTKSVIQKIHKNLDPSGYVSPQRGQSPSPGVAGASAELANTGALLMKSLNVAISYTLAGEDDIELVDSGHASDVLKYLIYLNSLALFTSSVQELIHQCLENINVDSLLIIDDNELANLKGSEMTLEIDLHGTKNKMSQRVKSLLFTIAEGFQDRSESIILSRSSFLFEKVLKLKIIKLVRDSLQLSYVHSVEQDYTSGDKLNDFIRNWNSLIVPYASILAPSVFYKLIQLVINVAVISLEDKIWSYEKKITAMGALNLENDISLVISELTKFDYRSRDEFLKITQMVMVLGVEDEDELLELEASGVEWSVTPNERSRLRKMLLK